MRCKIYGYRRMLLLAIARPAGAHNRITTVCYRRMFSPEYVRGFAPVARPISQPNEYRIEAF